MLQQLAFASGRLPTATTAMVVANPVTGSIIASIGFAEPLPTSLGLAVATADAGWRVCLRAGSGALYWRSRIGY